MRLLRPKEAARKLGVTIETLRVMDKHGDLHPVKTTGNQRRFHEDEVKHLMGIREQRLVSIYIQVSSHG